MMKSRLLFVKNTLKAFFFTGIFIISGCSNGGNNNGSSNALNSGTWTWISGESTPDGYGVYGVLGIPAKENHPGARCCGVTWVDSKNNLWVFGGTGYNSESGALLNDTWEYDVARREWAWINGESKGAAPQGNYGQLSVPSSTNQPPARLSPFIWRSSDSIILFGGEGKKNDGGVIFSDFWLFDTTKSVWSWIGGTQQTDLHGVYGDKGEAAESNFPGARFGGVTWLDTQGRLWLFGGNGFGESMLTSNVLNDLWVYDSSKGWAWMSGSKFTNIKGYYGIKGQQSTLNNPPARINAVSWSDKLGNLWLFGGIYYTGPDHEQILNDLWRYDIATNQWTWMGGESYPNTSGNYGIKFVAANTNQPGARFSASAWQDKDNNFWLFGGFGSAATSAGNLNDLWKYDPSRQVWTWMGGSDFSDQTGTYGLLGVPEINNIPSSLYFSMATEDIFGNGIILGGLAYIQGGQSRGQLINALWYYNQK